MIGFTSKLKRTIFIQDNFIKSLHKELSEHQKLYHNKQLEITRVAADNAVLKQRVIDLESLCNNLNEFLGVIEYYDIEITRNSEGKITGVSRERAMQQFFSMEEEIITLNLKVKDLENKLAVKEEPAGSKIHIIGTIDKPAKKDTKPKNKKPNKSKK